MKETILIIFSLFILWLIYELIKATRYYKDKEAKQGQELSYGDEVEYFEPPRRTKAMVIRQVKSRVKIRTEDDMKIWTVDREDLRLIENKSCDKEEVLIVDGEAVIN